jgi:Rrf2 family iron-sulfur cluster assembly transcriptional regulator
MIPTLGRIHAVAIAIMVDLACQSRGGPVATQSLRGHAGISDSYFEKIAARLRRHGLVHTVRGPGPGNTLGRAASDISVRDIVRAMETPLAGTSRPRAFATSSHWSACRLSVDLWDELEARQLDWLESVTLAAVAGDWLLRERDADGTNRPGGGVAVPAAPARSIAATLCARPRVRVTIDDHPETA